MNEFEKYIRKAAEQYSLSADEKARMESVLKSYMSFKPVREHTMTRVTVWTWLVYIHRPMAAALVFVLITSSTAAYAAESALPGDALYAVKTYVTEPARVAFAYSAEARAEAHIVLAERRIEEAATLAAEGRLDEDTQNNLATAFESHAEAVAEEIEHAEAEDEGSAVQLESRFETRLAAHEAVLAEVEFETDTEEPRSHKFAETIRSRSLALAEKHVTSGIAAVLDTAIAMDTTATTAAAPEAPAMLNAKMSAEVTTDTSPAPEYSDRQMSRMKHAAENSLENAKKSLRKAKRLSSETKVRAEADLALAAELLAEESYDSYQKSLRVSENASVYIKAAPTLEKARARNTSRTRTPSSTPTKNIETSTEVSLPGASTNVTITASTSVSATSTTSDDVPDDDSEPASSDSTNEQTENSNKTRFNILQKFNISL